LRNADTVFGVFGYLDILADDGKRVLRLCTAEDDWLDNAVGQSAIPAGRYRCKRTVWHKTNTPTYEITGVPGRSRILFHWGNTEEDVEGCVMLGLAFGALDVPDEDAPDKARKTKWGIKGGTSRAAFDQFMATIAGVEAFTLDVMWAPPGAWRR
jgi:hypothetical protein